MYHELSEGKEEDIKLSINGFSVLTDNFVTLDIHYNQFETLNSFLYK